WAIPNVKANHMEKTAHPCQFPIALAQRLVKALCPEHGTVLDPFMGSGSTGAAAILEEKNFIGIELNPDYFGIAQQRLNDADIGLLKYREIDKPIFDPANAGAVARDPFINEI